MGANIGSTITAQILAFKVSQIALPAITVGFAISFLASKEQVKQIGRMLLGFGLVFYGMSVMSDAMSPLRTNQEFRDVLASLDTAIAAAAAGAVFTAVIQSSAATTGIVIVMAGQGLVSLDAAIAISLGANIGTCATAGLAAIGKPREAVRAAVVHFIFNVVGVLVWIGFIPEFAEMVRAISPSSEDLSGAARVAAEAPRQIANAHTIFNVANTALFIGFTTQFARLVEWLVPDRPLKPDEAATPKFLDPDLLDTPAVALDNVRFELDRLGDQVVEMLDDAFNAGTHPQAAGMDEVVARDKAVDSLHRAIIAYLGRISTSGLSEEEGRDVLRLLEVANGLEYIGDRVATDIAGSARKRVDEGGKIDPKRAARIRKVHADVVRALADAISAVANEDPVLATDVRQRKVGLNRMRIEIEASSVELLKGDKGGIGLYIREIELLEILNAIFRAARAIARTQIPVKEAEQALSAAT
jgi:phosphate:Na+ symporter